MSKLSTVLIVHNDYESGTPSGENDAVAREVKLLAAEGIEVIVHCPSSDDLLTESLSDKARAAANAIWSRRSASKVAELISAHGCQVAVFHNVGPMLSAAAVRSAHSRVPIVLTLHNYRLSCLNGQHFRAGQDCRACEDGGVAWSGIRHGCYRGSRPQSAVFALHSVLVRRELSDADAVVAVSPAIRDAALAKGVDPSRCHYLPNSVPIDYASGRVADSERFALVMGRLDSAKGVLRLVEDWAEVDRGERLVVAGEGPDGDAIADFAERSPRIEFVGRVDHTVAVDLIRRSSLLIIPSLWAEGFPTVAVEAMACGRALLVSDRVAVARHLAAVGAATFTVPGELATTGHRLLREPGMLTNAGEASRREYQRTHSEEAFVARRIELYSALL
ncbi:MAG: glycosyltransferase family 4 protein [bacterium]|nr:glycosyltransferase family 4 protein [bacterium]